jgi:Domain of unknown function (DUF4055)
VSDVSTPSADHMAMMPYWDKVDAILGGAETMRKAKRYLPKFPNESDGDYNFRLGNARFTNIFRDIVEGLASKPFARELQLIDGSPDLETLRENVDGNGNHMHIFAGNLFFNGIAKGISWVLVDYPSVDAGLSLAQEKALNIRPYWVNIQPNDMIAAESKMIGGKRAWTHIRFKCNKVTREAFEEKVTETIREMNRDDNGLVTYSDWTKTKDASTGKEIWVQGELYNITLNEIPLVCFMPSRYIAGDWQIQPMMQDAADLQVEIFQLENALKYAKDNTAFPMLAGNGVQPPMAADGVTVAAVPVGPKSVLYAPPNGDGAHGEWTFIEPSSESLRFLAEDLKETIMQAREVGRQPLTAQTGNLTTVMAAQSASKGNSAVASAALKLKDALENAWRLTALWMKDVSAPTIDIYTDFDLGLAENNGADLIDKGRARGDISQETYWAELKRRNLLSAEFDSEEEELRIANELPDELTQDASGATGQLA